LNAHMWVGVLGKIKNFKSLNELLEYISLEEFFGFVKFCDIRTLHTGELQKFSKTIFDNYLLGILFR
jgi:hypothetical protein